MSVRETVLTLADQIQTARLELEHHDREAAARRALLVELEAACAALTREAGNASTRRRVHDPARLRRPLLTG